MAKANVLFITSASRIGGAERVLVFILKNLNRDLFLPAVLIPEEGILYDELSKLDVKIFRSKLIKKLNLLRMTFRMGGLKFYNPLTMIINAMFIAFYFLSSLVIVSAIMRRSKADIIHVNSDDIAVRSFLAASFVRKPVVHHVHSILKLTLETLILFWTIDMPFRTICVSNAARRPLLRWSKDIGRVKTVYNGADLSLFDGQSDADRLKQLSKSLKLDNLVVGIVGRFDPSKGHETFLDAASKVIDSIEGVSFLVVGSWVLDFEKPRVDFLKQYAKNLGLQDKVIFTGFIANVKDYYHLMDIVVVPSLEEPFALVPLEAMACRRPVIGTNSGGTPELIKDGITGILVPPKDPDALSQAIVGLFKDRDLRQRLSSEGRKIVEEFFNGERFISDMESAYKEAASLI